MAKYKALATIITYLYYDIEDAEDIEDAWEQAIEAGHEGKFIEETDRDFDIAEVAEVLR